MSFLWIHFLPQKKLRSRLCLVLCRIGSDSLQESFGGLAHSLVVVVVVAVAKVDRLDVAFDLLVVVVVVVLLIAESEKTGLSLGVSTF